jgi:hypothetical protein
VVRVALAFDVEADLVLTDFVDAVLVDAPLEEGFGLRPLVLVLKGFAIGARLGSPVGFGASFVGGCFFDASVVASEVALPEIARKSSAVEMRWSDIYCTPKGFAALPGWVEVSEMTGAGSFGWGPG